MDPATARKAEALFEQARHAAATGSSAKAEKLYLQVLKLLPNHPMVHNNLGGVLLTTGRLEKAEASFRKALSLQADFPPALYGLGSALAQQNRLEEAALCFRKTIDLAPDAIDAMVSLGRALTALGRAEEAVTLFEARFNDRAKLPPKQAEGLLSGLCAALGALGKRKNIAAHCGAFLVDNPSSATALIRLSQAETLNVDRMETRQIRTLLSQGKGLTPLEETGLGFALGGIMDKAGQFDQAFTAYKKANDLWADYLDSSGQGFDADAHDRAVETLIAVFNEDFFAGLPKDGLGESLIFILGMPRSGTSLVEQILAAHPEVHGGGERNGIPAIRDRLQGNYNIPQGQADDLARAYLADFRGGKASRLTDKLPANFLNIGLIAHLFPKARIIHCTRDARDTCLSCYFQHFSAPMPWAYRLSDLGRYYGAYERIMDHWRQVSPLPMLEVPYGDLVADQEAWTRKLIEFCGLPWNEACLEFHTVQRTVHTASDFQVRQPIYTRSIDRWKPYEGHLGELGELLDDPA